MFIAGINQKYHQNWLGSNVNEDKSCIVDPKTPIGIMETFTAFLLLGFGTIISFLRFLQEKRCSKARTEDF